MQREIRHIDISLFDGPDGDQHRGAQGRIAHFAGRVVSFATLLPAREIHGSGIPCRRRPQRRPCPGRLEVGRGDGPTDEIHWFCPVCRDTGSITGWKGTRWDLTHDLQSGQIVSLFQHQAQRASRASSAQLQTVYLLDVELIGGPIPLERPVFRRVRLSADKTLHDLHELLRHAFDWLDDEPYDFMFGAPYEPDARRFTGGIDACESGDCDIAETRSITLDSLDLRPGLTFGYLFDFGEEWIHRVTVASVTEANGHVQASVVERKGTAPPQHPDPEDLWQEDLVWAELDDDYPMTGLYGPYSADETPEPEMWLALDELERQLLVSEAHSHALTDGHPECAKSPLHAIIHCMAETALANGTPEAVKQLRMRLRQGVSRHEAIHELGTKLATETLGSTLAPPATTRGGGRARKRKKRNDSPSHKARS